MGSMYDMGAVATAQVVENNRLKCGIHDVIFKGIEKADYQSTDGTEAVDLTFEAVDGSGTHKERLFEPKSADRSTATFNNVEVTNPSQVEQFMAKIKQIISALNPEIAASIESGEKKFTAPSFDGIVKLLKKILDSKVGTKTQIKLVPNGRYAAFPGFPARISKNGDVYMSTKFIGDTLTLNSYESSAIDKANSAAPTQMSSADTTIADMQNDFNVSETEDDDLPF